MDVKCLNNHHTIKQQPLYVSDLLTLSLFYSFFLSGFLPTPLSVSLPVLLSLSPPFLSLSLSSPSPSLPLTLLLSLYLPPSTSLSFSFSLYLSISPSCHVVDLIALPLSPGSCALILPISSLYQPVAFFFPISLSTPPLLE